ncbi:hypothetical protein B9Z19DRAFT_1189649 [Tuber borchii]|uniref:Uncharacterized protein n=1 Tax=Tuber borchii TaxID=42251 RepID=A0A2T7A6Q9_TUBBO|nr:hypothetical protein B9Z19DRAFT_1189649 [Tuber borchii]
MSMSNALKAPHLSVFSSHYPHKAPNTTQPRLLPYPPPYYHSPKHPFTIFSQASTTSTPPTPNKKFPHPQRNHYTPPHGSNPPYIKSRKLSPFSPPPLLLPLHSNAPQPPPFLSDIPPTLHVVNGMNNNISVNIPAGEEYAAQALEVVGSAQIQDC